MPTLCPLPSAVPIFKMNTATPPIHTYPYQQTAEHTQKMRAPEQNNGNPPDLIPWFLVQGAHHEKIDDEVWNAVCKPSPPPPAPQLRPCMGHMGPRRLTLPCFLVSKSTPVCLFAEPSGCMWRWSLASDGMAWGGWLGEYECERGSLGLGMLCSFCAVTFLV